MPFCRLSGIASYFNACFQIPFFPTKVFATGGRFGGVAFMPGAGHGFAVPWQLHSYSIPIIIDPTYPAPAGICLVQTFSWGLWTVWSMPFTVNWFSNRPCFSDFSDFAFKLLYSLNMVYRQSCGTLYFVIFLRFYAVISTFLGLSELGYVIDFQSFFYTPTIHVFVLCLVHFQVQDFFP